MEKANEDLRRYAKMHGVYLWEIASEMLISEMTLMRWMRTPLSGNKRAAYINAVNKLSDGKYKLPNQTITEKPNKIKVEIKKAGLTQLEVAHILGMSAAWFGKKLNEGMFTPEEEADILDMIRNWRK